MRIIKKAKLPLGFKASALACGLKRSGKLDLALLYSENQAKASGLFTTNKIAAAPVILCKKNLHASKKGFRAVIANSGNANCFTGVNGLRDAQATINSLARALKIKDEEVFVASTGIIGRKLDIAKIKQGIPALISGLNVKGIDLAKRAIMTTDKFSKDITAQFKIGNKVVTICAIAKGAGMIAPDMATMLCFILTDAHITKKALDYSLKQAVGNSFNCITVDGCMSTNDTVIIMANSKASNEVIEIGNKGFDLFSQALGVVCLELGKMMVKDGEGASKLIEINVGHARNYNEAKAVALAVANSNLFKTAMYGQNPNFGRIVASAGSCGVSVSEDKIKVKLGRLDKKEVKIWVDLGSGNAKCRVYTSDLTPEYIKINAAYN